MAEQSLFHQLEIEAFRAGITPRSKESIQWFRKKAGRLFPNRSDLLKDEALTWRNRPGSGKMYMYFYDPKHKKTLPYYDRFPLIIMVEAAPKGFYGLNLHYLPLPLRAKFLDALMKNTNNNRYDESTKFKLSYSMLKAASKLKEFKPCFKRYLSKHVRSKLAMVSPPEWEIATFLPTADFEKSTSSKIYKESRKLIRS